MRLVFRRKTAYVAECKVAVQYGELGRKAEKALKQIEDNLHERELRDEGYTSIFRYGTAFFGKDCEGIVD